MKNKHLRKLKSLLSHNNQDLSLVDNIFAIFVAATLALTFNSWISKHLFIITSVFVSITVLVVSLMVTTNLHSPKKLWVGYVITTIISFISYEYIMWASSYDLHPERYQILALPYGVIMWVFCRELSVVITNIARCESNPNN
jgi:hypothetical protein